MIDIPGMLYVDLKAEATRLCRTGTRAVRCGSESDSVSRVSKLVIVAAIGVLLSACEQREDQPDSSDLTEFATGYAAAWSSQDPEALASFYSENGSLRVNDGEASVGRDAVAETAGSFMTAFPDMVVRLVRLDRKDGYVEFHWHWTGTNTGPGGTGSAVDLRGYERWTLDDDGLILESLGHFDEAEYQRQLNAPPATIESDP